MSSKKQQRLKRSASLIDEEIRSLTNSLRDSQKALTKHIKEIKATAETFGDQIDISIPAEVFVVIYNYQDKMERRDESIIVGVFSEIGKARNFIKNDLSEELTEAFEQYYDQKLSPISYHGLEDNQTEIKARAVTSKGNKIFIKIQKWGVE